jgi:type 1 glutamine amidotransferase
MITVLALTDDFWHPGEVVERGLQSLKTDEFRFDFVRDAKDILSPEMIARYPAIVSCKSNQINGANQGAWFEDGVTEVGVKELEAYVAAGKGFLSLHSANTGARGSPYADFVGNYFIGHPPRCKIDAAITGSHPIVKGVGNFSVRDEHYALGITAGDREELFHTTSETGGRQLGGYVRNIGKGRLCVMALGHILSTWENESYQKLLINALRWCLFQN